MRAWSPERVAEAAGARLLATGGETHGCEQVSVDSRDARPGVLFVGLPGARADGGTFAPAALAEHAWGVLVAERHADAAVAASRVSGGVVLAALDPLRALHRLARAWRREVGARVVAVTGSTGKTSTKDILAAMLAQRLRTHASRANLNTEIGLPLELLRAPRDSEAIVLELAMRGPGQIAELCEIAEPDVAVITNVGPVHLEQLGSLDAVAAEKAAVIRALPPHGTAVVPVDDPLLRAHLRDDISTVSFGPGGDVSLLDREGGRVTAAADGERIELELSLEQAHNVTNALAALAAARALGVTPGGRLEVELSALRGQERALPGGVVVIDDCYNANPMSMRAALEHLAARATGRRVAVLGDMLELGEQERAYHEQVGHEARAAGVALLVTVGPRAAAMAGAYGGPVLAVDDAAAAAALLPRLIEPGDTVLVKGSRGVGLEVVAQALTGQAVG